jgi:hypothetical protein
MIITKNCTDCNYFEQRGEKNSENQSGLCRFNPPTIIETVNPVAYWPSVQPTDWCGKFAN